MNKQFADNLLLVVGYKRGGTTWLSAMLSRHPEIAMQCENTKYPESLQKVMGVKYSGNKLLAHRQIRYNVKGTKFGYLINRIVNLDLLNKRKQIFRPFPTSKWSIKDYINKGAKVIVITRNESDNINSITRRDSRETFCSAKRYRRGAKRELEKIKDCLIVSLEELQNNPRKELKLILEYLDLPFDEKVMEGENYTVVYPEYYENKPT